MGHVQILQSCRPASCVLANKLVKDSLLPLERGILHFPGQPSSQCLLKTCIVATNTLQPFAILDGFNCYSLIPYSLLPTPYSLLPTPYSLLLTPYSLLLTPYPLLPTPYSLLPTPYSLLPTPYSLLLTPYSLLPTPYSLLPTPM